MPARRTCAPTTTGPARSRRRRTYLVTVGGELIGRDPPQIAGNGGIAMDAGTLTFTFNREGEVGKNALGTRIAARRRKG